MRVHNLTAVSGYTHFWQVGNFEIKLLHVSPAERYLYLSDWNNPATGCQANPGTATDLIIRGQKNAAGQHGLQVWDGSNGTLISNTCYDTPRAGADDLSGTGGAFTIGGSIYSGFGVLQGNMAYFRLYSTSTTATTAPAESSGGDLLDYEFENNLTDSSPQNKSLAWFPTGGTAAYTPTPGGQAGTVAITLATSPSGLTILADGAPCISGTSACTFQWSSGSSHSISVASPQAAGGGTQRIYSNWSDGGAQTHNITVPSSATTYAANFSTQYYLTTAATTGGSVLPASGWYNAGASVTVSASNNAGYQFTGYSGDLTGTNPSQSVTMSVPRSVTANFAQLLQITSTSPLPSANVNADYRFDFSASGVRLLTPGTRRACPPVSVSAAPKACSTDGPLPPSPKASRCSCRLPIQPARPSQPVRSPSLSTPPEPHRP